MCDYYVVFFFFFEQKTSYELLRSLVGSEMCIRDRAQTDRVLLECNWAVAHHTVKPKAGNVQHVFRTQADHLTVAGTVVVGKFTATVLSLIHI